MPLTFVTVGNIVHSLTIPNGTSASPGLRFSGSKTSGLYTTGTNVGISANGIGKVVVSSTGLAANGNVSAQYFVGDGSQLTNIAVPMTVSNIHITDSSWTAVDDTAFSTTTNGYCLVNGTGFGPGSLVKFGTDWATSTVYVSSTQLRAQVPAKTSGTYDVTVVRGDAVTATLALGATYSTFPVWSTGSTLANIEQYATFTQTLSAPSDSTVTYANTSVLPPETTLASNGTFSGTVTSVASDTMYTFTVKATDLELQDTSRTFSVQYLGGRVFKVVAGDKSTYSLAGQSVAMNADGTRIVVGTGYADAVYMYRWTGTTWTQEAKFSPGDWYFGYSVYMNADGTRVVVGAYQSNPDGTSNAGAAYVFSRSGTTWTQEAKLVASDKAANDWLGFSAAMNSDGSRVVVGAILSDPESTSNAGAAYVFSRSGTTWTQEAKLVASDKAINDNFGQSVSINNDGSRVIVGTWQASPGGTTNAGAAYVFSRSDTTWTEEAKLTASDKATYDYFGYSVSMTADRAIVGAYLSDPGGTTNAGAAYVFSRSGTTWTEEAKLTASDKASSDDFGSAVSINSDGSLVIIGAYLSDPGSVSNAGAAYVFSRSGTTWTEDAKLVASDKESGDNFGTSVFINADGTRAIVGAIFANPGGTSDAGAAYVCKRKSDGSWAVP